MRKRRLRRLWYLLPLVWALCIGAAVLRNSAQAPLYVGRTTLVLIPQRANHLKKWQTRYSLGTVAVLAETREVLGGACRTLADLGRPLAPDELRKSSSVERIPEADLLAVEVESPDPKEAKMVADVLASELRRAWQKAALLPVRTDLETLRQQVRVESAALSQDQARLRAALAKTGDRASREVERLTIDAQVRVKAYARLQSEFKEGLLAEEWLKSHNLLATVDPAYVYPADHHSTLYLGVAAAGGWIPGLIVTMLARWIGARRRRNIPDEGATSERLTVSTL